MPDIGNVQFTVRMPLRDGIISSALPLSETSLYDLINFRVNIDGLESVEGWQESEGVTYDYYSSFHGVDTIADKNDRHWVFVWNSLWQIAFSPYSHKWFNITIPDIAYGITDIPQAVSFMDKLYVIDRTAGLWSFNWIEGSFLTPVDKEVKGQTLMKIGNRLLAGNLILWDTEVPHAIRWSELGQPNVWDSMAYMELPDDEYILRMFPLSHGNNVGAIYTRSSIYIVSYTGDAVTPFALQKVASSVYIQNPRAVAVVSTNEFYGHAYACPNGAFLFTGNEAVLISENIRPLWREFYENASRIEVFYNPIEEEIIFGDYGNKIALVYQLRFRCWYKRSWTVVGAGLVSSKEYPYKPIFVGVKEKMNFRNFTLAYVGGMTDSDSEFSGYIETPVIMLGGSHIIQVTKLLLWIFSRAKIFEESGVFIVTIASSNNFWSIASSDYLHKTDVQSTTIQIPVSQLMRKTFLSSDEINVDLTGRYFRLRVSVSGIRNPINITGYGFIWHPLQYTR